MKIITHISVSPDYASGDITTLESLRNLDGGDVMSSIVKRTKHLVSSDKTSAFNNFNVISTDSITNSKKNGPYRIPPNDKQLLKENLLKYNGNSDTIITDKGSFLVNPMTDVVQQTLDSTIENLDIGSEIAVGDYSLKINNLYGLREGKNRVNNIAPTEHSGGIDYTTFDAQGNKVNVPIIVAGGTIIDIHKDSGGYRDVKQPDGSFKSFKVSGGTMVTVQLDEDPSKVMRYMHVPNSLFDSKDLLVGKKVTRGQVLADSSGMSGTGTGKHTKISLHDYNTETGDIARNNKNSINDPSGLLVTGYII